MTNITSVPAAGAQIYALRNYANAKKAQQPSAPQVTAQQTVAAKAKVDDAMMRATYTASLDNLRTANKMMMGYLLNIEV
jgi:hypothetical protein